MTPTRRRTLHALGAAGTWGALGPLALPAPAHAAGGPQVLRLISRSETAFDPQRSLMRRRVRSCGFAAS